MTFQYTEATMAFTVTCPTTPVSVQQTTCAHVATEVPEEAQQGSMSRVPSRKRRSPTVSSRVRGLWMEDPIEEEEV